MNLRNDWLDFLKLLGIISVVIIHTGPFYHIETLKPAAVIINNLMRYAVPCFFMCTGYFLNSNKLFDRCDNYRIIKNVKKLVIVYFLWSIIYWFLMPQYNNSFLNILFFSTAPHLWFLSALIQCLLLKYILNYIFNHILVKKMTVLIITIIIFIVVYYTSRYGISSFDYTKTVFAVFVFYIYGAILRSEHYLKTKTAIAMVILGIVLQLSESILAWKYLALSPTIDFNIGTLLYSIGIFNFFLGMSIKCPNISYLGRDSLGVYLIHYYVIDVFNKFHFEYNLINDILKIIFVLIVSYTITVLLKKIDYLKILVGH